MKCFFTLLVSLIAAQVVFPQTYFPLGNFLRTNAHAWDFIVSDPDYNNQSQRTDNLVKTIVDARITGLRFYGDVPVLKSDDNLTYRLNPDGRGFRIDSGLLLIKGQTPHFNVDYCYQSAPKNLQADYDAAGEKNTIYVRRSLDRNDPSSYSELGRDLRVLASHGGTNPNAPDYELFVSPNWWETPQRIQKGLGTIDILESGNEPDNKWSNTNYMDGYQVAALCKGVYDSIKQIDPNMIVSTPGVASEDTTILRQAIEWCQKYNKGAIPFDRWQCHAYASGMWNYNNNIASGIMPEISTVPKAVVMAKYAAQFGIIPYIGEHSYDQHQYSWIGIMPFANANYTAPQRVAYWGLRELLGFAMAGMEAAYYYKWYQDWGHAADSSENLFATSSLAEDDNTLNVGHLRLIGYVYRQLQEFRNFVFYKKLVDDDFMKIYIFRLGSQYLYACWTVEQLTTIYDRGNRAIPVERKINYNFPFSGTRYDINEDSSYYFDQKPFYGGTVELSSKPFFILTSTPLALVDNKPQSWPTRGPARNNYTVFTVLGQRLFTLNQATAQEAKNSIIRSLQLSKGVYILAEENGPSVKISKPW